MLRLVEVSLPFRQGVPYTWGVAYHIPAEEVEAVMSYLEVREKVRAQHIARPLLTPERYRVATLVTSFLFSRLQTTKHLA